MGNDEGAGTAVGLVMGFDTHMIAGAVPALRPARPTQPNITNRSNPHYDETLGRDRRLHGYVVVAIQGSETRQNPVQGR
jgi:hypothetical protein